jgi:ribose 5-phosphate isomerase B
MHIVFGSDHAGYKMKQVLKNHLKSKYGVETLFLIDIGCNTDEQKSDYPDFAKSLCEEVLKLNCLGVLICETGIGISIAANRNPNIRCALCHSVETAQMARQHNNANVLAIGGRILDKETAKNILDIFISEKFEGGRHQNRLYKI